MIYPQIEKGYLTVLDHVFGKDEKIDNLYYMHLASDIEPIRIRELSAPGYYEELWAVVNCNRRMLVRLIKETVQNSCYKYDWICYDLGLCFFSYTK